MPMRLDKFIRDASGLARNSVAEAWREGRIDFEPVVDPPFKGPATLVFEGDRVRLDGVYVEPHQPETYVMFHKPGGVITASSDPYDRPCLDVYLSRMGPRAFPVGRLDKATTGLLLITDDGDLAHMMMHPDFHVPKRYRVDLNHPIENTDPRLEKLQDGVELRDGFARFVSVEHAADSVSLLVTLEEGRNRQVRRMFARVQLEIAHLHREAIGRTTLDVGVPGDFRTLSPSEVENAWREVGGRSRVYLRKVEALHRIANRHRTRNTPHTRLEEWLARSDV